MANKVAEVRAPNAEQRRGGVGDGLPPATTPNTNPDATRKRFGSVHLHAHPGSMSLEQRGSVVMDLEDGP